MAQLGQPGIIMPGLLLVERKSMKIRGEKRFHRLGNVHIAAVHVFVLDECKYIYQEGCSSSFRDVACFTLFVSPVAVSTAANENSTKTGGAALARRPRGLVEAEGWRRSSR